MPKTTLGDMKLVSVHVPESWLPRLRAMASARYTSRSQIIREALLAALNAWEARSTEETYTAEVTMFDGDVVFHVSGFASREEAAEAAHAHLYQGDVPESDYTVIVTKDD